MPEDYRLTLKVQNNIFYSRMQEMGHRTVADLSRATGVGQGLIGDYLNMKQSPIGRSGTWLPSALKLADYFGCLPDELFNEQQIYSPVDSNVVAITLGQDSLAALIGYKDLEEDVLRIEMAENLIDKMDQVLSEREKAVLDDRFFSNCTLEEAGRKHDVTRERLRQIEIRAIEKLKNAYADEIEKELI